MANEKIVEALVTEDLYTAKKLINETLLERMAKALEDKLIDFGPTIFNEATKPDFLDLDKDGNKKEPMKKAAKEAKKGMMESEDSEEIISEQFEEELKSLVEEIEEETGTQLSEEEIMEIAESLLEVLSEEQEEDEDEDEDEEEDDGENYTPSRPTNRTIGGVDYWTSGTNPLWNL